MNRHEFKRIRKEVLQVNQSDLANVMGVALNTISRFEVGTMSICPRTRFSMLYFESLGHLPTNVKTLPPSATKKQASKRSAKRKKR